MRRPSGFPLVLAFCPVLAIASIHRVAAQPQFITPRNVTPGPATDSSGLAAIYGGILAYADFTGDRKLDFVTTYNPSGTKFSSIATSLALLVNNGDGSFHLEVLSNVIYPTNPGASSSAAATDVDGDGINDLVIVNTTGNDDAGNPLGPSTLYVYLGNGDGSFRPLPPQTVTSKGDAAVLFAGDLNGDRRPDLLITQYDQNTGGTIVVWLNNGNGQFHQGSTIGNVFETTFVTAGDLYGHGRLDLVVNYLGSAQILVNAGDGTFTPGAALPLSASSGTIKDVNRDGRNDLIVAGEVGAGRQPINTHVFLNEGVGKFTETAVLPGGPDNAAGQIYAGDVNHDGFVDIVYNALPGTRVYTGDGKGKFSGPSVFDTGAGTSTVFADWNGDGNLDVLNGGHGTPFLLSSGHSNGNFGASRFTVCCNVTNGTLWAPAAGDFNKDGKNDLAVVVADSQTADFSHLTILDGNGLGWFVAQRTYNIGPIGTPAVGDVNGDGDLDVVVASTPENSIGTDVSVLLGNGDGTFNPVMVDHLLDQHPSNAFDHAIYLRDVNGDGKLDLVGDWGVALGNGDGTFKAPIALPSGIQTISYLVADDFNRDGKLDLIIASNFTTAAPNAYLYTLLGDGKGSFRIAHTEQFAVPGYPVGFFTALASADLTGDGIPDLLFTGTNYNQANADNGFGLYVRVGKGDGTFAGATKYAIVSSGSDQILAADYNRDGLVDVLVASQQFSGDEKLVLFPGVGAGKLSSHFGVFHGTLRSLLTVNMNGDTAPDVVGLQGNGIERLINTGAR
jgi:hypothetical protein